MLFEEDAYGETYPLGPDWFEVRIDAPRDSDDGGVSQRTWRTGKPPCKEEEAPRGLRALREEWYRNRVEDSGTGKSRVKESGKYSFFIYLGSLLGPFTPISSFFNGKATAATAATETRCISENAETTERESQLGGADCSEESDAEEEETRGTFRKERGQA